MSRPADDGAMWRWIGAPDWAEFDREMGNGASPGDYAVMECAIASDRRLSECRIIEENPGGGMGRVLLAVRRGYRAASTDANGQSTVGRKVQFAAGLRRWAVP